MKSLTVAAALFAASSYAFGPDCAWNDCMGSWDGTTCDSNNGWACLCSNSTAISQLNTCVATSCTNATDQETIYGAVAQLCANNGVVVTASQQATFSATSGGTFLPQITAGPSGWGPSKSSSTLLSHDTLLTNFADGGWDSGDWASWVSSCSGALPGAPSGWAGGPWGGHGGWGSQGGPGGSGGWGPGMGGPWGTKASGIACDGDNSWTTWTGGWGPFSSWTGVWSGCSSTTASPSGATVTTTVTTGGSTQVLVGTTFGVQALSQSAAASTSSDNAAPATFVSSRLSLTAFGAVAGSVFALMVML
jgi:CFEM domain